MASDRYNYVLTESAEADIVVLRVVYSRRDQDRVCERISVNRISCDKIYV